MWLCRKKTGNCLKSHGAKCRGEHKGRQTKKKKEGDRNKETEKSAEEKAAAVAKVLRV